ETLACAFRAGKPAVLTDLKIDRPRMTSGTVRICEHEKNIHGFAVPCKRKPVEIRLPAINPERIRVENEERLVAQGWQSLDDAARRIQQFLALIRDGDCRLVAVPHMLDDLVAEIVHVDDGSLDAAGGEAIEPPVEQRSSSDLDKRLRRMVGQWTHALAEPGRQNHRLFRLSAHNIPAFS